MTTTELSFPEGACGICSNHAMRNWIYHLGGPCPSLERPKGLDDYADNEVEPGDDFHWASASRFARYAKQLEAKELIARQEQRDLLQVLIDRNEELERRIEMLEILRGEKP